MKKSYNQKCAHVYAIWRYNKKITRNTLQKRLKGTKWGMRRETLGDLLRGFKNGAPYLDVRETTKQRLNKTAYLLRLNETVTGLGYNLKIPKPNKADELRAVMEKMVQQGNYLVRKHIKRYIKGQVQYIVLTHIQPDDEDNDEFKDWLGTNGFPVMPDAFDNDWEVDDVCESYSRILAKLLQSFEGKVSYCEVMLKAYFWHE